jgi:hypothetical protein
MRGFRSPKHTHTTSSFLHSFVHKLFSFIQLVLRAGMYRRKRHRRGLAGVGELPDLQCVQVDIAPPVYPVAPTPAPPAPGGSGSSKRGASVGTIVGATMATAFGLMIFVVVSVPCSTREHLLLDRCTHHKLALLGLLFFLRCRVHALVPLPPSKSAAAPYYLASADFLSPDEVAEVLATCARGHGTGLRRQVQMLFRSRSTQPVTWS